MKTASSDTSLWEPHTMWKSALQQNEKEMLARTAFTISWLVGGNCTARYSRLVLHARLGGIQIQAEIKSSSTYKHNSV